jgi:D-alanine-D-alanine ligase
MRITVLTGGATPERAVAFAGAAQVVTALRGRGHEVHVVDLATGPLSDADERQRLVVDVGLTPPATSDLVQGEREMLAHGLAALAMVRSADVVFLVLHGGAGEGGIVQAVLEVIGVPYTGSGPLGSALAVDKDLSKRLFRAAGVPVADWVMTPPAVAPRRVKRTLGMPVIVKPSKQGSTVGLTLVKRELELAAAVAEASRWDDEVMLEAFIPGRELTVGVLGDQALPPGEIIPRHELFDYECKYTPGMSEETFPAKLPAALARRLQALALTAHRAIKLGGYSRIDFRVTPRGRIFCLEANNLPGLTRTSLYPQAARAAGIDYAEMCERICRLARNFPHQRRE